MGAKRTKLPHNRIAAVMAHTTRYAFKGQARLAADAGVSKAAISRLIAGKTNPTYEIVAAACEALEQHTGRQLHPRELISFDGTYPTSNVCELVGCKGCLPDQAYNADGSRSAEYDGVLPGMWSGDTSHHWASSIARPMNVTDPVYLVAKEVQ